jgi:hypothetical protein
MNNGLRVGFLAVAVLLILPLASWARRPERVAPVTQALRSRAAQPQVRSGIGLS